MGVLKVILLVLLFEGIRGTFGATIKSPLNYNLDEVLNYKFPPNTQWEEYLRSIPYAEREDAYLKFVPLAQKYGYPSEEHLVATPDGYILTIHRIPHGKNGPPKKSKGVVFLQHGILASAIDWIITGPEGGFGYLLADKGYDVWLGNARGNKYSKNHTTLSLETKEYWDFSFHEIGTIDLPTMIDYVLETTGEKKLSYIGHSQGNTAFYVMCSELPEYNDKIRGQFSLAPIAYMDHMTSPLLRFMAWFDGPIELLLNMIGAYEFLPTDGFLHNIAKFFCDDTILQPICSNSLFLLCGFDKEHLNTTLLPIVMEHVPAGASTKQMLHFSQLIKSGGLITKGKFRQYDYGRKGNKERYGQKNPPSYDLSKVVAPVYLFYSKNDWLAHVKDVRRLEKELGNLKHKFLVPAPQFNHLDYVFGIGADNLVYDKVMSLMVRLPK